MRALILAALAAAAPCDSQPVRPPRIVTVFAAASLTDAFSELGRLFEGKHPGLTVRFNFAGSQQLAAQLEQGAPADVLAAADRRWMDYVVEKSLVRGAPRLLARNRLVAIVPASNPGRIERLQDLARPGLKLVLAAETVPAGKYGRQVLGNLGAAPGFPDGFAAHALANLVSEEENVKGVVAKVQLGEADAGLVYRSDVTPAVAPKVRMLEIPAERNVLAEYPIAVLAGAADAEGARSFVDLALSSEGQAVLERHGLLPATRTP